LDSNDINKFSDSECLKILDFGSGVNFFPFAISKLGANVTCVDIDELCIESLLKIKGANNDIKITPVLSKDKRLPFEENSFDIIYSVSVFEHLTDIETIIMEIKRILKKDGILIITFDVSLNNNYELTLSNYQNFHATLEENFNFLYDYKAIHPNDILTSQNSLYPFYKNTFISTMKFIIMNYFVKPLLLKSIAPCPKKLYLAVEGVVLEKKK
jgi:SAM-dependent methyltransferase